MKNIIDYAAESGYTRVEPAPGNDGLRFLPDDMLMTADFTTYSVEAVVGDVKAGNMAFCNSGINELTQT